jgi:hypothetical protein
MARPVAGVAGAAARLDHCGWTAHVRSSLVPYLGGIRLAAPTAGDVQAMFTAVTRDEGALGRPVSTATLHRIHATLRAALNGKVSSLKLGAVTVSSSGTRS